MEDVEDVAREAAAMSDEGQARGAANGVRLVPPKVGSGWFIARSTMIYGRYIHAEWGL